MDKIKEFTFANGKKGHATEGITITFGKQEPVRVEEKTPEEAGVAEIFKEEEK